MPVPFIFRSAIVTKVRSKTMRMIQTMPRTTFMYLTRGWLFVTNIQVQLFILTHCIASQSARLQSVGFLFLNLLPAGAHRSHPHSLGVAMSYSAVVPMMITTLVSTLILVYVVRLWASVYLHRYSRLI